MIGPLLGQVRKIDYGEGLCKRILVCVVTLEEGKTVASGCDVSVMNLAKNETLGFATFSSRGRLVWSRGIIVACRPRKGGYELAFATAQPSKDLVVLVQPRRLQPGRRRAV